MPGKLDGLAATASSLVTDFGKTATLTRVTKTANAATGITSTTTATETVIITPPTPRVPAGQGGTRGEVRAGPDTVEVGDLIASVAANDVTLPSIGDRVTIDGEEYQIVSVGITYAGEVAALYNLALRS